MVGTGGFRARKVMSVLAISGALAILAAVPAVAGLYFPVASGDGTLIFEDKVLSSAPTLNSVFGEAVAIDATTAVVGDRYDYSAAPAAGSASVYVRDQAGVWHLQQKLTAPDPDTSDQFGVSVAVSGDTVLVGAYSDDEGGDGAGAVYIYERTAGAWTLTTKHVGPAAKQYLGIDVAIDGDIAVAGAMGSGEPPPGFPDPMRIGYVQVYSRATGSWEVSDTVWSTDYALYDMFGTSVDISGDRLVAGSPWNRGAGSQTGSAYTYELGGGGWVPTGKLTPGAGTGADYAHFGEEVAISGDRVLIGAPNYDDGGWRRGRAYAFAYQSAQTTWTKDAVLSAPAIFSDDFASAVALHGDRAIVGCADAETMGYGAAHTYAWDDSELTLLSVSIAPDASRHSMSSQSVALTDEYAILGSPYDYQAQVVTRGSAYLFGFDGWRTSKDTTFTMAAPGVLANDAEYHGDPLTAVIATQPANGSVTMQPDGSFEYVPDAGWTGRDTFTYRSQNNTGTSIEPATVAIYVDAPLHTHTATPDRCTACHGVDLEAEHTVRLTYVCDTCHTSVDPDVAAAIASGTPSACTDCHAITPARHGFAADLVDRGRCRRCHWYPAHYQGKCWTCHAGATTEIPGYKPRVFIEGGYFESAASLTLPAAEIHAIHVEGSWLAGRFTPLGCDSCHAPAKCQACHGRPSHGEHAWVAANGAYLVPPITETVARGTWVAYRDRSQVFDTTCVVAMCHARASHETTAFAEPDCRSCHP